MTRGFSSRFLLARDTLVYGLTTVVGRLLNWLLVPYYTHVFSSPADNGVIANLYGYSAFLLIFLTYGMETAFFRFSREHKGQAYGTALTSLFFSSSIFLLLIYLFITPISSALGYANFSHYILIMGGVISIDAFSSIIFAKLRYDNKVLFFSGLKTLNILITIGLNLFFFLYCEYSSVWYVFLSNFIASVIILVLILPQIKNSYKFYNFSVHKKMLRYGTPLLFAGIAGLVPQHAYTLIIPFLLPGAEGKFLIGQFAPSFKLGVLMNLFTQSFRFAFEPFFFRKEETDSQRNKQEYANILLVFTLIGLVLLLTTTVYSDIIILILGKNYQSQVHIIPFVFMGFLFTGMSYTISLWYKLTDKTRVGARLNLAGAAIYLIAFLLFLNKYNTLAISVAFLLSQLSVFVLSYSLGRIHYPVPYNMKRITFYIIYTVGLIALWEFLGRNLYCSTLFVVCFVASILIFEKRIRVVLSEIYKRIFRVL